MATESHNDPLVHSQLSHFKILSKLGEGGMGRVYKALDTRLQRYVAMKLLSPDLIQDPKALKRFRIEAVAASTINHPNICTIYEIDKVNSHNFIAMEYIEGPTLRQLLQRHGLLPEWDVIQILEQMCAALRVAHEAGIVHLDIKPDNILVSQKTHIVKITDFGLARLASDTAESRAVESMIPPPDAGKGDPLLFKPDITATIFSSMMGTAAYMSPEQVKRGAIDFRSDIWSLGVLMHELLTGDKPFHGESQVDVLEKIAATEFDDSRVPNTLPNKWKPVIGSCLKVSPDDRYQSVNTLLHDVSLLKKNTKPHSIIHQDEQDEPKTSGRIIRRIVLPILFLLICAVAIIGVRQWILIAHQPTRENLSVESFSVTTTSVQAYDYFLKGRQAWWRYDGDTAIQNLQMAVEADNSFAYANCLLGVLYLWRQRDDEASHCFLSAEQQLVNLDGWEKLLVKGYIHYYKAEYDSMLSTFDDLVAEYPNVIDGYLGAALACERLFDFEKAIHYTEQVLDLDPSHIAVHGNLSNLYEWKGDLESALKYAQQYLNLILASGNLNGVDGAYEQVGTFYHFLGKSQQGIFNLEKALEIAPRNRDARKILVEIYTLDGQLDKGENVLKSALSMPLKIQERASIYFWYSKLMLFHGRFFDALDHFEKARELAAERQDTKSILVLCSFACNIYIELNQLALAQNELDFILEHLNNVPKENRLWSYFYSTATDLAIAQKNMALAQEWTDLYNENRKLDIHLLHQGRIEMANNNFAQAESLLLELIAESTKPFWGDRASSNYMMAQIRNDQKRYAESISYCHEVLKTRHFMVLGFPGILAYLKSIELLSEIYEITGETDKALAECDRFLMYWKNADPGITLLVKVQERRERLLGK